ncbi:helix-turn-helix domain-containing protein [Aminipila terrae]|uniref:Helix-turn-helix domain-containing protein n=1 Tax=Aminipila terrae TaxID=2697030 RepID=A0A6P1MA27_9FIRM|nr:helix-turn-helix transcriptional regulator [Aminipila terrae]QHI71480.1 helix-turn-helix domain-containing protein [Aminipila terrae]
MNFLEKLNYLMDINNINKHILSKESGIPYSTIDNFYKKGYEKAKLPTMQKLAKYFDTTVDYLIMDEITDVNYGKTYGFQISFDEMNYLEKYRALSEHGKQVVDLVLNLEYDYCKADKTSGKPAV